MKIELRAFYGLFQAVKVVQTIPFVTISAINCLRVATA